ncbi:MAG: 4Fe-4S binding protein [Candidatus Jordarchaeum sp.]|uniref:4Fe-4S binding protein n=1 Tax=Candidatus Jordarchaeum sp. TaxID=2823881 RepID=UPI00404927A3
MNKSKKKLLAWNEIPIGGFITEPGNAREYRTGDWREGKKPVYDKDKCNKCLLCWIYCPEGAIEREEDGIKINYFYCKGCGVCSVECPVKAIEMEEE